MYNSLRDRGAAAGLTEDDVLTILEVEDPLTSLDGTTFPLVAIVRSRAGKGETSIYSTFPAFKTSRHWTKRVFDESWVVGHGRLLVSCVG